MRKHSKAVSPIVATMLLIAIVVAAAASVALLVNYYINQGNSLYEVELSENAFYDFDGDGRADMAVFDLTTRSLATIPIENVSVIFSNGAFVGDSWWALPLTSRSVSVSEPGQLVIAAGKSSEQFSPGDNYALVFDMVGSHFELTGVVSEVNPTDPFTIQLEEEQVMSATDQLALQSAAMRNDPDALRILAQGALTLTGIKVVLFDARTDLPAVPERTTDANAQISLRLRAGQYYLKIFLSQNDVRTTSPFTHPASLDNFRLFRKIAVRANIKAVNVHYSENSNPVQGATILAFKKVVVGNRVVEQVTGLSKTTDTNGTSQFFLLNGEYKFHAYHGSQIPAVSSFVDVSTVQDVYINTEPGIVYVKVLQANGNPVPNAYVRAYSVIGTSSSYVGYSYTNASGIAQFSIAATYFRIQVTQGATFSSGTFLVVPGSVYEFYLGGNTLSVNMTTASGQPVTSVYVSLYDEFGRSISSQRTNDTGFANFYGLNNGTYYVKYYSSSGYVNSPTFDVISDMVYNITISGNVLFVNLTNPNGSPRANQYVYLYNSETGTYLGYARTNSSGIGTFVVNVPENTLAYMQTYAYINGRYTYISTNPFNVTNGLVVDLSLGGTTVQVHVEDDNGNPIRYAYVNAYSNGNIAARQYLNSAGNATFLLQPNTIYTVGIDYGAIIQTAPFNSTVNSSVVLIITTVSFTIHVKQADGSDLSNARVYLYSASKFSTYLGFGQTDATGRVNFNAPESGMYRVYVYSSSPYLYFYSGNFTISAGATIVIQPTPATLKVMTSKGNVLANTYVYLYTPQGSYAGWARTNSTGFAQATITNGSTYVLRTGYLRSAPLTLYDNQVNTVVFNVTTVYVRLQDQSGSAYVPTNSWTYVYAYYASNGTYTGYGLVNSSGIATLLVPANAELVARVWIGSREILSSPFNSTDGLVVDMTVIGHTLTVGVTVDGSPIQNAYVYLYDAETNRYSGWSRTNSTGYAVFNFILNGSYYARVYAYPVVQNTPTFNVTGDTVFQYSLVTTTVYVKVFQIESSTPVGANQYVYLRTTDGLYGGRAQTNSSGVAAISAVENATYLPYSYYSGTGYIYGETFNATPGAVTSITPVRMYVRVIDGANATVPQMNVYLSYQGLQAGYARTNSSGIATIYGNNQTEYVLLAAKGSFTYSAYSYIGGLITANSSEVHEINIGGGTVYVQLIGFDGNPVTNTYVYLYRPLGNGAYQWTGYYALTNSTGFATFTGVGSGTYVAYSYVLSTFSSEFDASNGLVVTVDASSGALTLFQPMLVDRRPVN